MPVPCMARSGRCSLGLLADNIYGDNQGRQRLIDGPFSIGSLNITPLPVDHAKTETIGFLFESPGAPAVAYIPDAKRIPPETLGLLRRADILILDALRAAPHPTHLSTDEALEVIAETGSRSLGTHLTLTTSTTS